MIRILIVFCSFFLIQDEPVLSWKESHKLTWSDFKGTPNLRDSAVAVTASGISFGYSIKQTNNEVTNFSTQVHAHFYPEQSWYKPDRADIHVLNHEQLHFDITELHARKLRYEISKLKITNHVKSELKTLQKNINIELKKLQDKYDLETNFSRNKEAQAQWKAYITQELKRFSKYKSN